MKSLKKTLREGRLRTHEKVRSWLQPKLADMGTRYRLPTRVRLANRRASKHPKRTFVMAVGTLLVLLVGTAAIDSGRTETQMPCMDMIADMTPVFTGFHTIQAGKSSHLHTLQELTLAGQEIRQELDSMIAIPCKTRTDSMHIIQNYRKLENIVKFIRCWCKVLRSVLPRIP